MPDCYNCKHRSYVTGSAHSQCNFFTLEQQLILVMGSAQIVFTNEKTGEKVPVVEINPVGKNGGWANWPLDFDPNWISNCLIFKAEQLNETNNQSNM